MLQYTPLKALGGSTTLATNTKSTNLATIIVEKMGGIAENPSSTGGLLSHISTATTATSHLPAMQAKVDFHALPIAVLMVVVRCQPSMLSKGWFGAECTQYSELSVIVLGEPPPSDT